MTLGDRYELHEEIGAGAFSVTYRALDRRLGRQVAVKILRSQYARDPTYVRRFEREARAAASVSHPNVVDVHDFGQHGDRLYIVMQYIEGENLKERLLREGPLPQQEAVRVARQVLAGLATIHRAGIIHRDIKPQNILIGRDGITRVADFGVAHLSADAGLTTSGTTLGTASYMAPEQAQGGPLVRATDLYAVGVVLYEMLTGRLPFEAPTAVATIVAHIQSPPVPPSYRVSGRRISPALDHVVMRAMAKRPEDRFADAAEMRGALAAAIAEDTEPATRAVGEARSVALAAEAWTGRTPPPAVRRRRRALGAAWALALMVLLTGGGVMASWLLRDDPGEDAGSAPTAQVAAGEPTATVEELTATGGEDEPSRLFTAHPSETPTEMPAQVPTDTPAPTETPEPSPTETPAPTDTPEPTVAPTETLAPIVPIEPTSGTDGADGDDSQSDALTLTDGQDDAAAADAGAIQRVELSFTAASWQGAYYQETGNLQPWSALYAQSTGYGQGSLSFTLDGEPASDTFVLIVEGMTSENWTALPIAIRINGQEVYSGNSPFPTWNGVDGQQPWTAMRLDLPTAPLQPGENTLTFVNMVAEGGFSLPPYILLAGGTLSVDIQRPNGAAPVPPAVAGAPGERVVQPFAGYVTL